MMWNVESDAVGLKEHYCESSLPIYILLISFAQGPNDFPCGQNGGNSLLRHFRQRHQHCIGTVFSHHSAIIRISLGLKMLWNSASAFGNKIFFHKYIYHSEDSSKIWDETFHNFTYMTPKKLIKYFNVDIWIFIL